MIAALRGSSALRLQAVAACVLFQLSQGIPIMQLREIITTPVHPVTPDSSLLDAAKTMMTRDLGWLPVTDEGKVVGIITDRDITVRGVAGGLDTKKTKVEDVMSRDVFACSIDSTVEDACNMM